MTPEKVDGLILELRLLIYTIISNAYPVVTKMRSGYPALGQVRVFIAYSKAEFKQLSKELVDKSSHKSFVKDLLRQIFLDPLFSRAEKIGGNLKKIGIEVWMGLYIEVPDNPPENFNGTDIWILEQIAQGKKPFFGIVKDK